MTSKRYSIVGVYAITRTDTNEFYVGSSVNIGRRWSEHRSTLRKSKHHSERLQNSWNKYGATSFTFSILEECSVEVLAEREKRFIDTLLPVFNMDHEVYESAGFRSLWKTPEFQEKMKCANARRWEDPEHRLKMKGLLTEVWANPDTRELRAHSILKAKANPEYLAKMGVETTRRWQDPTFRSNTTAKIKAAKNTPERKKQQSDISKLMWSDPEFKARMIESAKKRRVEKRASQEQLPPTSTPNLG